MKKNYQNFFSTLVLVVCAFFSQFSNAQCTGNVATGPMPFSYSFKTETNGSITATYTLLNNQIGLVVHVFKYNATGGGEVPYFAIPNTGGLTWSKNFTVTEVATEQIKIRAEFVWADGGYFTTPTYDYTVGDNCTATPPDTEIPTNFTATIGVITPFSVELLLNATDNSGAVIYNVTGGTNVSTSGNSGVQKSFIIKNLTPETAYDFSVTAKDAAGNTATNTIPLSATTTKDTSTPCAGRSSTASDGTFSTGYNYNFSTINGTDVTISFTLLDTDKTGIVGYIYKADSNGANSSENGPITPDAGNSISQTFTGLTAGTPYNFAAKFAYAGGQVITKHFPYTVGDDCSSLGINDAQLPDNAIKLYPNPAKKGIITVDTGDLKVSKVEVYSILGAKVLESNKTAISTSNLQAGIYFVKVYAEGKSITKKLIVN